MFKAAAVVSDTKRVLKNLDGQGLAELRALQKPDNEIEDLLAAIIIIGEHGKFLFSVGASVPLVKMNMTQQLACVQTPCILVITIYVPGFIRRRFEIIASYRKVSKSLAKN